MNEEPDPLPPDQTGRLIGMAEAARLMRGKGGRAPHVQTVRRWQDRRRGCPCGDGGKAYLRTVRLSGEILTLPEWVREFEAERLRRKSRPPAPRVDVTPRRRAASKRRADAILDAAGI